MKEICKQLDDWKKLVDKSGLPGKYKEWILPRLLWPLLVYGVPKTGGMETAGSSYLRRWLEIPPSFSNNFTVTSQIHHREDQGDNIHVFHGFGGNSQTVVPR